MNEIRESAYAKLNLSLDVTGRRDDGYHNMLMVMQTVSLCDELTVRLTDGAQVRASTNMRYIPSDERNLAVRAVLAYLRQTGREGTGVAVDIRKRIPVGAGLAGGSADAAAALRAMNRLFDNALDRAALYDLACGIGSDVAFCLTGGTVLASGRGEELTALPPAPECLYVICKPRFSISTPDMFKKIDSVPLRRHPDTAGILQALSDGDLTQLCRRMYNVFEDVDDRRLRTIAEIKSRLIDLGALGAVMSGTGSASFGMFSDSALAASAASALSAEYGFACVSEPVREIDIS